MEIKKKYIITIDQGTTSSKVSLVDLNLNIIDFEQKDHDQIHLNPGWTNQNPNQIFFNILLCLKNLEFRRKNIKNEVICFGITNQRETCLIWDRVTGEPLTDAIVWHDTRTTDIVEELFQLYKTKDYFRKKTGLPINHYFSAVKFKWLMNNEPEIKERLLRKEFSTMCFGTIDSWLIYKLTKNFYTDVTNASRTLLMNLSTLDWDDEILAEFGIPKECLPKILSSSDDFGLVQFEDFHNVPLTGVIGDQQSACLGHLIEVGEVKNTYGTGCFILMNTGEKIVESNFGLLTTCLYRNSKDNKCLYALEGAVETAGRALNWLQQNLGIFKDHHELIELYKSVEDNGDVYFVPSFSGLFSPYWDDTARGLIIGLTTFTQKGHIIRALFEGISIRSLEVFNSFSQDSGIKVTSVKVDGGLINNDDFLQTQADIARINVIRQKEVHITTVGATIAAGLSKVVNVWEDFMQLKEHMKLDKIYEPKIDNEIVIKKLEKWNKAVNRSKNWV